MINLKRCITDFPYYAANLLKIKDKDSNLCALNLWPPQVRLNVIVENLKRAGKLLRVVVLKARQEGISTYTEARIFHTAHLNENTKNVIIAHEKEAGRGIFGMCRLFYDCLPPKFRPMTRYSSTQELVFENPDKNTRHMNPGLRSSLEVYTAGKKAVARGVTIHNLHCSEVASWPFPEDVIPSIIPTIPKNNKSLVVFESTAKGIGNFFYDEWQRAKDGSSNFYPFFLAWFDLSEYSRKFNHIKERVAFGEHLNDEEKELQNTHSLTLEQLFWRRITIADLKGDVELFRQEYPATDNEAFIVSGTPMFDRRKLRLMAIKCTEPRLRGYYDTTARFIPDAHGEFKIWKTPEPTAIYGIGVDVSDGAGKDFSCIEVWKKLPAPLVAEQVAEWHGKIDPYGLAKPIRMIALQYNNAMVAVETNAHGLATQQELQRHYWNLYRREHYDKFTSTFTNKIGWETTLRTKNLLVAYMSHCVADMTILIHSDRLIKECMTFVRDSFEGSASAAGSGYDDRVMSAMVGLFTMHQVIEDEPSDEKHSSFASPISMVDSITKDVEFAQILAYGQDDEYEESWMNY